MLRLALIENLRRVSAQVIAGRIDRDLADLWGDRFTEMPESDPKSVVLVIVHTETSLPRHRNASVDESVRRHGERGMMGKRMAVSDVMGVRPILKKKITNNKHR